MNALRRSLIGAKNRCGARPASRKREFRRAAPLQFRNPDRITGMANMVEGWITTARLLQILAPVGQELARVQLCSDAISGRASARAAKFNATGPIRTIFQNTDLREDLPDEAIDYELPPSFWRFGFDYIGEQRREILPPHFDVISRSDWARGDFVASFRRQSDAERTTWRASGVCFQAEYVEQLMSNFGLTADKPRSAFKAPTEREIIRELRRLKQLYRGRDTVCSELRKIPRFQQVKAEEVRDIYRLHVSGGRGRPMVTKNPRQE